MLNLWFEPGFDKEQTYAIWSLARRIDPIVAWGRVR